MGNFLYEITDYSSPDINNISNSLADLKFNHVVKIRPANSLGRKALYKENPLYGYNLHKTPVYYRDNSYNETDREWMILEYTDKYEEVSYVETSITDISLSEYVNEFKKTYNTKIASQRYLKKERSILQKNRVSINESTEQNQYQYQLQQIYYVCLENNIFYIKTEYITEDFNYKLFGPVYYIEECYNFINNYTNIYGLNVEQTDDYTFVINE